LAQNTNPKHNSSDRATDWEQFEALLKEHLPELLDYASWRVRHGAGEDVLQIACLSAWRAYPGFRGDASFVTWMRTIIDRQSTNHWRAQLKGSRTFGCLAAGTRAGDLPVTMADFADDVVSAQLRLEDLLTELGVAEFVAALPKRQAFALRMRCVHELIGTPEEALPAIAKALDISLKAAEHLDYRARIRFRELWDAAREPTDGDTP